MNQLNKCDLCESTNLEFVDVIQDYNKGFKGNFNLYKCKNCELMFLNPQPTVEESLKYYTSDYYQKIDESAGVRKVVKNFTFYLQKFYAKNPDLSLFPFSQYVRG